jgi:hypothetical protein
MKNKSSMHARLHARSKDDNLSIYIRPAGVGWLWIFANSRGGMKRGFAMWISNGYLVDMRFDIF